MPRCLSRGVQSLTLLVAKRNCSGSAPLLLLWFLLTFVLRVAVLRWILLGNILRVALALMFLWILLALLLFLLLWIFFSFVTHIAPFNTSLIWRLQGRVNASETEEETTLRCGVRPRFLARDPYDAFRPQMLCLSATARLVTIEQF
jgi:hypothetical protein